MWNVMRDLLSHFTFHFAHDHLDRPCQHVAHLRIVDQRLCYVRREPLRRADSLLGLRCRLAAGGAQQKEGDLLFAWVTAFSDGIRDPTDERAERALDGCLLPNLTDG